MRRAGGDDDLAAGQGLAVEQVDALAVRQDEVGDDQVGGFAEQAGPRRLETRRVLDAVARAPGRQDRRQSNPLARLPRSGRAVVLEVQLTPWPYFCVEIFHPDR